MGKNAKLKKKQKWSHEKLHLHNARKLRGIYRNQGKAVITGFHNETSEPEVIQVLKESITEIGMTMENLRIECPAKPITHAFIHFKNDEERNKFVRSANRLKKRVTSKEGKNITINGRRWKNPSKKSGVCQILYSWERQHSSRFDNHEQDSETHIGQRSDCGKDGILTYIKYHDIEAEVEEQMEKIQSKNSSQRLWAVERSAWK